MPNKIRQDITLVDRESFPYIFEQNVTIALRDDSGLIRAKVYRPKNIDKAPVLVTYGPYAKDIHYKDEVNSAHHSEHSAWETPDPALWTKNGYVVVGADERGTG
ncbi:hypothetical protein N7486_002862 [Penicillium sp. IBT 16267x]|nr:hypothetical protein N7486_002862 [Penicillium sp. IBT 16267x]